MRLRIAMFAIAFLFVTAAGTPPGSAAAAPPGNAAVAPPGSAVARFGLRLESATVLPGGTIVDVHYVAICPPGAPARVGVSLAQRAGAHVAVGRGGAEILCNGVPRSVRMRAVATGGGLSFQPGRARIAAELQAATGLGIAAEDDRARLVVLRR
ncbi:hypothetical protein [Actinoplanes sp. NPDC026619]|uniref:hypothetical protein n=1 Tax=Actinoplanes sp. NPDC026619 TaxID=3155798 RepID=UPI0033E48CD1